VSPTPSTFHPREAILASAGSGKTEELALRFIRILLRDPRPESILAITFTRLAAREMLERIVRLLAQAVLDDAAHQRLCANLACTPAPTRRQLEQVLRLIVDNLHRLHLGTIDSFFSEVARCFALELGLDLDYTLLDDAVLETLYLDALRQIFQAARQPVCLARVQEIYDGLTEDKDRRKISATLADVIETIYGAFLSSDAAAWRWGRTAAQPLDAGQWQALQERCRELLPDKRAASFFENLHRADWAYVFKNGPTAKLLGGSNLYYKTPLTGELADVLRAILAHAEACVIGACQRRTENMRAFLELFNEHYQALKTARALLSFDDVARVLQRVHAQQAIMYERLDSRIDHLLLDEFQDTSWTQWRVLAPLADEILCDPSERRTFFMVGDVKQAIYGFRGGDARLFAEVLAWYNHAGPRILEQPRNVSYRSGANILALVNQVFDEPRNDLEFADDFRRWRRDTKFAPHLPAATVTFPGYAEVRVQENDAQADGDETVTLLQALQPWRRNLRTALLFRTNDGVNEYLLRLRQAGIPAFTQGKSRLFENAAVQAVLAALRWASAPEDSLAERQLRTSFLAARVPARDAAEWLAAVRARLVYTSYAETLQWLCADALDTLDTADRARLIQLFGVAEQYQAQATADPRDFVAHVEAVAPREPQASEGVICSTIHTAKGLNFDVVILPEMNLARPNGGQHRLFTRKEDVPGALEEPRTTCVLARPPLDVCRGGTQLKPLYDAVMRDETMSFCNMMYVALTRASKALYVICAKHKEQDFAAYLLAMLAEHATPTPANMPANIVFQHGDPKWFESYAPVAAPAEAGVAPVPRITLRGLPTRHRPAVRPSKLALSSTTQRAQWFTRDWLQPAQHGTLLHNLLQHVLWRDAALTDAAVRALVRRTDPGMSADDCAMIERELLRILATPNISALLTRPAEACEVCTELAFAALLPAAADDHLRHDALLRGAMDRVVLYPSAAAPQRIEVYDFKTGRVPAGESPDEHALRYAEQLQAYRTALARGYNLSEDKVTAWVVLTACDAVCRVA